MISAAVSIHGDADGFSGQPALQTDARLDVSNLMLLDCPRHSLEALPGDDAVKTKDRPNPMQPTITATTPKTSFLSKKTSRWGREMVYRKSLDKVKMRQANARMLLPIVAITRPGR